MPTSQHAAMGSWRAKVRGNEPRPDGVGVPPCPSHLTDDAARVWSEMAPRLESCGLLTGVDVAAFERYCRTYAVWRRAIAEIELGESVDRLDVAKVHHLDDMLRRLERSFGLNPADRADMSVSEKKKANGKSRFFEPKLAG